MAKRSRNSSPPLKRGAKPGPRGRPKGGAPQLERYGKAQAKAGGPAVYDWYAIPEAAWQRRLSPVGVGQFQCGTADWVITSLDLAVKTAESILFEYGFDQCIRRISDEPILDSDHALYCDSAGQWWTMNLEPESWRSARRKDGGPDFTVLNFNSYCLTEGVDKSDTIRRKKFLDDMGAPMKWAFAVLEYRHWINRRANIANGLDASLDALLDRPEWARFCYEIEGLGDPKLTRAIHGLKSVSTQEGRLRLHKRDLEKVAELGQSLGALDTLYQGPPSDSESLTRLKLELAVCHWVLDNARLDGRFMPYPLADSLHREMYGNPKDPNTPPKAEVQKQFEGLGLPTTPANIALLIKDVFHPNLWS